MFKNFLLITFLSIFTKDFPFLCHTIAKNNNELVLLKKQFIILNVERSKV